MHPPQPSTSEGRLAGAASSASSGKSRTSEMKEASGRASSSKPAKFLEQEESLKVRDPTFREAAGDYTLDPKKAAEIMDKHLQYLKTKREEIRERSVKPQGSAHKPSKERKAVPSSLKSEATGAVVAKLARTSSSASLPERGPSKVSRPSSTGSLPERDSAGPNRSRGEMTPEELQEIWSKKARTPGQRAVEHALNAAATSELKYQENAASGLEKLIDKQSSSPTVGGDKKLASSLKAISSSATTALVTQKRLGRGDEPASSSQEFGREVASCLPEAEQRLNSLLTSITSYFGLTS